MIRPQVLQVITGLGVGGAERVVLELASEFSRMESRSCVVSLNSDLSLVSQYVEAQFKIESLNMQPSMTSFFRAAFALRKIIRHEGALIVHAHMYHALMLSLVARGLNSSCKIVFTSHSCSGFSRVRRALIWLTRPLRSADIVFFPDQHVPMNARRTLMIPNGVRVDQEISIQSSKSIRGGLTFLYLGRLEKVKDPIALVREYAKMKNGDNKLWIAGDGELRKQLEAEVRRLGISGRVSLLGRIEDVASMMHQVDCLVMSSRWEGLPLVALEAGAVGLPVVAPPVGALPKLLSDDCGYLTSVSNMASTLDEVTENYSEALRRGRRLHKRIVDTYGLGGMCLAHKHLYDSLIESEGS